MCVFGQRACCAVVTPLCRQLTGTQLRDGLVRSETRVQGMLNSLLGGLSGRPAPAQFAPGLRRGAARRRARMSAVEMAMSELDSIHVARARAPESVSLGGGAGASAVASTKRRRQFVEGERCLKHSLFVHHVVLGRLHSTRLRVDVDALSGVCAGRDPGEVSVLLRASHRVERNVCNVCDRCFWMCP